MKVAVHYEDQSVEIDVPESSLVGRWQGEVGVEGAEAASLIAVALDNAIDYPALRQTIVPGDRVAIALGQDIPEVAMVFERVLTVMNEAGVGVDAATLVADKTVCDQLQSCFPAGLTVKAHNPADRESLAYLASTQDGRRIYLNREIVDADFVITIGLVGFDRNLGYRGPWSVLLPELSDEETQTAFRSQALENGPDRDAPTLFLRESWETSWLLGSQFQIGILPGLRGVRSVLTGLGPAFNERVVEATEAAVGFHPESRAELVIAGVGSGGEESGMETVASGLTTACQLVQRGGKIVILSRAKGKIGRTVRRLVEAEEARVRTQPLRGLESEPDYATAAAIAKAVAWADVYLLSEFDHDIVEGLGMIPLDKPQEARRLAALSGSCTILSHADRVGASVDEESE